MSSENKKIQIPIRIIESVVGWFIMDDFNNTMFGPFATKQEAIDKLTGLPSQFRNKHSEDIN